MTAALTLAPARRPATGRVTAPPGRAARPGEALLRRSLQFLVVFIVFGQRLALPFGPGYVSISFVVVWVAAIVLYRSRVLVEDRDRAMWYLLAVSLCVAAALVRLVLGAGDTSVSSLMLLVVLYAPFSLVVRPDLRHLYGAVVRTYCACALIIGVLAVLQFLAQLAGVWTYSDLVADVVPHSLLVNGYNTAYPISYGSSLIKANGVFCLEPSFCSQILALGVVGQLVLGEKQWRVAIMLPAIVATVSGTGVLLLMVGLLVLMVRRGAQWAARVLLLGAVLAGLTALTPYGRAGLSRVTEVGSTATSGNQRLVAPYTRLWHDLSGGPADMLVGRGPGYADREANAIFRETGLPAQEPPLVKLITEYGLIAGTIATVAIGAFLSLRVPSSTIAIAVLAFYFFLSASLLEGQTVYLSWLLASVFGAPISRRWQRSPTVPRPGLL